MVTVKYTSRLRVDLGRQRDRVNAASIAELIADLEDRYGETIASWMPLCRIFINGIGEANLEGHATSLADGDEVLFLLPVAGG